MAHRSTPYLTLASPGEASMRVRGSTFLAIAAPAPGEEAARALLAERARALRDATHHCSAWRLHGGIWRANDAGEPSGSAGAPILAAVEGAGVEDCVVVVTRYFGGTKLGVGGLVRAYGEAAAAALAAAPRRTAVPAVRVRIRYPYAHTAAVMRILERVSPRDVQHGYALAGAEGEVVLSVPGAEEPLLRELLREQTAGALDPEPLTELLLYLDAPARPGLA